MLMTHIFMYLWILADVSASLENLEHCIADIQLWMTSNVIKLNENKTGILYIYIYTERETESFAVLQQVPKTPDLQTGGSLISPTDLVQNLHVLGEKFINKNDHVTSICRSAYYHLKTIRSLRPFLSQDALITVVHAFVTSRIDYCNSVI